MVNKVDSLSVKAEWHEGYRVDVTARNHILVVDEPNATGGQNQGPMPSELFLASLAACLTLSIRHICRKMRIEISQVQVTVQGLFDRRNFTCLQAIADVSSSLDSNLMMSIANKAIKYCYVSNTVQDGCPVTVRIKEH
jgi:putative redox protein